MRYLLKNGGTGEWMSVEVSMDVCDDLEGMVRGKQELVRVFGEILKRIDFPLRLELSVCEDGKIEIVLMRP